MDEITKEENSLLTNRAITLSSPVKRPRTHCITNCHSGESLCDFPEILPMQKTSELSLSESILHKTVLIVYPTENLDVIEEKAFVQLQETKLIITPFTKVTTSFLTDMLSSEGCVIATDRQLVHLRKQHPPLIESDKLCSYLSDEAGGAFLDSHNSKDATTGTSSHSDYYWLGKSLEDKGPIFPKNDKDGRQVILNVTQMQGFPLLSCDGEVRCQSFCSCETAVHDAGNTSTLPCKYAEIEVSNQKKDKHVFNRNVLFCNHTRKVPKSARVSQELAEKDNNAVFYCENPDPVVWSKSDLEGEEKNFNLCAAGVELSALIKVCKMEVPQEVSAPNQIWQILPQSYTEPKAGFFTASKTQTMTDKPSSSPCQDTRLIPVADSRQKSHSNVGFHLKGQHPLVTFPNGLDKVRRQEAVESQNKNSRIDWARIIKSKEGMPNFKKRIHEQMALEKEVDSEEHLQESKLWKQDTPCVCNLSIEGEAKCIEHKLEEKYELFSNHLYSVHMSKMIKTTFKKAIKKIKDEEEGNKTIGYDNSDKVLNSEDNLQQQSKHTTGTLETSHVKCVGKEAESPITANDNNLNLDGQNRDETCFVLNTNDFVTFTSHPTSDSVVPCQNDSSHSQNSNSPTTLNCSSRFSPVPSAYIRYNWVREGVDIFQKIPLSPDDYDNIEAGLGSASVSSSYSSFPGQLVKPPQQQIFSSLPENKSNEYQKEEEKIVLPKHYDSEYEANCDTRFTDAPNFISATDVIVLGWPVQQPNCESTCNSFKSILVDSNTQLNSASVSIENESLHADVNKYPEFDMKKHFDMVLKELNLFFDIGSNNFASEGVLRPKQFCDISKPPEAHSSDCKEVIISTDIGCYKNTSTDADVDPTMETCGGDPVIPCLLGDGEQEVTLARAMYPETCLYTTKKCRETLEVEQRRKTWSPTFMILPLQEQLSHKSPEQSKRLEPLRTCTRPIRVGLSRRAKTKRLHHPHPYK